VRPMSVTDLAHPARRTTRPKSSAAGPFCLSGLDSCAVERFRRVAHARADSVWAVPQVVVVLLLLVVFVVDLPVVPGAAVVGAFALLDGHAHGSEVAETGGLAHMAGVALATVTWHAGGALLGNAVAFSFPYLIASMVLAGYITPDLFGVGPSDGLFASDAVISAKRAARRA